MDNQNPSQPPTPPDDYEWRRRRFRRGSSSVFIGLILILLGSLFFLTNQGYIGHDRWWQYFLIGLGIIFLFDGAMRYRQQNYHGFLVSRVIAGLVLLAIGIIFLLGATAWWPLILILAGIGIIIGGLVRRSR
jgi:phosphoglycerol transferase MdoB-like AlkP superfamily enzyme